MRFSVLFLSSSLLLFADKLDNLSLQSFTGLINTPNAQVINKETVTFSFNNQVDNHLRYYDYDTPIGTQQDYMIGLGFLSNMEVVARLSETDPNQAQKKENSDFGLRDLGASLKFKLPFHHQYLPNIALGLQDIGGASNFYTNSYVVLDKKISFLRASLGYGKSGENKAGKRMDGLFGGIEAEVTGWASLLAEHDGKENHIGVRLNLPRAWSGNFNLNTLIAQNLTESATSLSLNLSIPLGKTIVSTPTERSQIRSQKETSNTINPIPPSEKSTPSSSKRSIKSSAIAIQQELQEVGFENIQVGIRRDALYVKCENSIFEHNDLDALGIIFGIISKQSTNNQQYIVTLLKNNLQVLTIAGFTNLFKAYIEHPNKTTKMSLKNNLRFYRTFDEKEVNFIGSKSNGSFFKPRLELSPGIISTVGTEIGLFDYALSLRANAYTTLYDGLTLSARYEIPLTHSKNFDEGEAYGIMYQDQLESRLVNTMLHQTLHYESILNTTSIGRYQENYNGLLNHTNLTTASGEHGFNLRLGSFSNKENNNDTRDIYLGSYRYFYAPLDLSAEVMYGQFWNQDKGGMLKLKRFFGDTAISFYLKDSVETYAGFELSLPLTWQEAPNHSLGQIKGKKDFFYGIRSVVRSPSGGNYLTPGGAILPKNDLELETHYLNRDRLNGAYIKEHLERIRESYLKYKKI